MNDAQYNFIVMLLSCIIAKLSKGRSQVAWNWLTLAFGAMAAMGMVKGWFA